MRNYPKCAFRATRFTANGTIKSSQTRNSQKSGNLLLSAPLLPIWLDHLPIGSGVTEAACKTVFTQRLKQSGMTWKLEGGQWIVDLRVIKLSGLWSQVYQAYLQAKMLPEIGFQAGCAGKKPKK